MMTQGIKFVVLINIVFGLGCQARLEPNLHSPESNPTPPTAQITDHHPGDVAQAPKATSATVSADTVPMSARLLPPTRFDRTPLVNAIEKLAEASRVKIVVDWPALESVGVRKTTKVTLNRQNARLGKALGATLDDAPHGNCELCFDEEDGFITVSTPRGFMCTRTFDIGYLFPAEMTKGDKEKLTAQIVQLVKDTVSPDTWEKDGRNCFAAVEKNSIVVTQTRSAQRDVENLLAQLRETRSAR